MAVDERLQSDRRLGSRWTPEWRATSRDTPFYVKPGSNPLCEAECAKRMVRGRCDAEGGAANYRAPEEM
jgi:hypothetical protein